jgi:hypothetical protein
MNKNKKTLKTASTFTFGIFDEFQRELRMGFVSHDAKQLVLDTASQIVEVSLAGGEETYELYKDKTLRFKDALDIFETHGFVLAIVPNYVEFLLEKGPQVVASTDKEAFFDGSNEGVKLLKIHRGDGANVVVKYYDATDPDMVVKGVIDVPNLASEVTWQQVIEVMKNIQNKHQIDLFAPGYFDTCSCCASPEDFPKKYFLNKEDANEKSFTREDGTKIKSLIIANSHNASGTSKLGTKKKSFPFGTVEDYRVDRKMIHQFIRSNAFEDKEIAAVLEDFVKELNKIVGEETYSLEYPEEEGYAFAIVTKQ